MCQNDAAVFGVSSTLFFEVLPFTDDASVVNGKTSKKNMTKQNDAAVFGVSRPLSS